MSDTWRLIDSGPGAPAFNMALDEALLESAPQTGLPVLRFYSWTQPAASFGYFQKFSAVGTATALRPLIRRPTGGGIVPHEMDWTYSVVLPVGHEWHRTKAERSYQRMHEWICAAFKHIGLTTSLAQDTRQSRPGECFAGHEAHDVLWEGHKVAGAAQRRTRTGLLIQGSIQPPPLTLHRQAWQQAMCDTAPVHWRTHLVDEELRDRATHLAAEKYEIDLYTRRR